MDISRASNFERFVFDLLDGDPQKVRSCWDELARTGHFDLSEFQPLFQSRYGFVAGVSTHADRLATIKSLHERTGVDRKSVGKGKSGAVRVYLGGRRIIKKKKNKKE